MQQVSFQRMDKGNAADFQLLNRLEDDFVRDLPPAVRGGSLGDETRRRRSSAGERRRCRA